jgi:hypothetical protein
MIKEVTHIDCPKEWESANDWDSHRPALWLSISKTKGSVYEMGCGYGSTPILMELPDRDIISYETNGEWSDKFKDTFWVEDYLGDIALPAQPASVLFVDAAPAGIRKEIINKWRSCADVIVVHDTEIGADYVYGLRNILNTFEYRLDYKPDGKPATTVVSNVIDVTQWINQSSMLF